MEDTLKKPFNPQEELAFEDYKQVLEKFLKEINILKQAYLHRSKKLLAYPDIVGTLTMTLLHAAKDAGLQLELHPSKIHNSFTTQNPQDKLRLRKVFEVFRKRVAIGVEK